MLADVEHLFEVAALVAAATGPGVRRRPETEAHGITGNEQVVCAYLAHRAHRVILGVW